MRQWLLIVILLLTGCGNPTVLDAFAPGNELVVITRNGPTTYYLGANERAGLEYELFKAFADSQDMTLRIKVASTIEEVFDTLARGEAHIAAAGLTQSNARDELFTSTMPYLKQNPVVVYKAGQFRPRTVEDLGNLDIVIMQGSHHRTRLSMLSEMDPRITFRVLETAQSSAVLSEIETEQADVALLDSSEFSMQQRLYPRVAKAFQFKETLNTVWYLGLDARAPIWRDKINDFLNKETDEGRLADLEVRYFGSDANTSRIELFTFQRAVESTLPKWRPLIEAIAQEFRLDWQLLAAIAYQESHWDPKAKSPTGVRGMMMLTRPTAEEVGVKDRLDAEQSLRGGARFLRNLLRRLPNDIEEPDRTWMALAAYNVGMAHLEEARRLTEGKGGDPHLWQDVRERLPDLQNPKIYPHLRHGFARGQEAVTYVDNIRHYQATLALQDIPSQTISVPLNLEELTATAHELLQWTPLSL
ncbi:MAG: membrane-bound lytic murein transglycosylase MltF [Halieaceae bacterium]